jgi:hypothetical protein
MQTATPDSAIQNTNDSADVQASTLGLESISEPVESLFNMHALQPSGGLQPLLIDTDSNILVLTVFGICASSIIYLQRNSDGIFSSILKGSFDMNLTLQESRVDNTQRNRNMLLLQVLSFLAISLFVSGAIGLVYDVDITLSQLYVRIFFGLMAFVWLKKGLQWILAALFQLSGILKSYHFSSNILLASSGLAVMPICLLMFFSPQIPTELSVYLSLFIIGFFHLKSVLRGVRIAMAEKSVSPLHLFYYLCALEILPVFVLVRIALNE